MYVTFWFFDQNEKEPESPTLLHRRKNGTAGNSCWDSRMNIGQNSAASENQVIPWRQSTPLPALKLLPATFPNFSLLGYMLPAKLPVAPCVPDTCCVSCHGKWDIPNRQKWVLVRIMGWSWTEGCYMFCLRETSLHSWANEFTNDSD